MDLGLDEIIKKNKLFKKTNRSGRRNGQQQPQKALGVKNNWPKKAPPRKKVPPVKKPLAPLIRPGKILDAREKITQKTRAKIVDARDRIRELARLSDARNRISKRRGTKELTRSDILPKRTIKNSNTVSRDPRARPFPTRPLAPATRMRSDGLLNYGNDEIEQWDSFSGARNLPKLQIQLHQAVEPPPTYTMDYRHSAQKPWTRPYMPGSVYRRNDDVKSRLEPAREEGYRIIVSNLQPSVTHEDIKELFEDIGVLISSRVVRPGTAEVVYKSLDNAMAAVDTYHNRQLDGQPMKCLLVKSSNTPKGMGGGRGSIVPDISTVHKALFSK